MSKGKLWMPAPSESQLDYAPLLALSANGKLQTANVHISTVQP